MNRPDHARSLGEIVRDARTGDGASFEELVVRFQDMAVGYCHALLGDLDDAADAAQDAFVEAWKEIPRLRHDAAFVVWFRRILHKHCDRRLRRPANRRATAPDMAPEEVPGPDVLAEQRQRAERLDQAVARLPEDLRKVTLLHYFSDLPLQEIATLLEIPLGTVKSRLHAARAALRASDLEVTAEGMAMKRPSRDRQFQERVKALIAAAGRGDVTEVRKIANEEPRLLEAEGPHPVWGGRPRALNVAVERSAHRRHR